MLLYSFQPLYSISEIIEKGFFSNEPDIMRDYYCCENMMNEPLDSFLEHYQWLRDKMVSEGVQWSMQNKYLIWAYSNWYGARKEPDRRYKSVRGFCGFPFVLMTLDIPESRMLVTDYDYWHFILNDSCPMEYVCDDDSCGYNSRKEEKEFYQHKLNDLEFVGNYFSLDGFDYEGSKVHQATFFEIFEKDILKLEFYQNGKIHSEWNKKSTKSLEIWYNDLNIKTKCESCSN